MNGDIQPCFHDTRPSLDAKQNVLGGVCGHINIVVVPTNINTSPQFATCLSVACSCGMFHCLCCLPACRPAVPRTAAQRQELMENHRLIQAGDKLVQQELDHYRKNPTSSKNPKPGRSMDVRPHPSPETFV